MTHTFYFHGSLTQYWEVLFAEYQRLAMKLGQPPFEPIPPNGQTIDEYVPKNGEGIIFYFWDNEQMIIWKGIRKAVNKASGRSNLLERKQRSGSVTNIYIGGNVNGSTIIAGDENEVNK